MNFSNQIKINQLHTKFCDDAQNNVTNNFQKVVNPKMNSSA